MLSVIEPALPLLQRDAPVPTSTERLARVPSQRSDLSQYILWRHALGLGACLSEMCPRQGPGQKDLGLDGSSSRGVVSGITVPRRPSPMRIAATVGGPLLRNHLPVPGFARRGRYCKADHESPSQLLACRMRSSLSPGMAADPRFGHAMSSLRVL